MEQIMIVEDDLELNKGLCKALAANNRQFVSCPNLKTANAQLLCGNVSLVLLDINLPDGNGIDLLRELKAKHPEIPVLLLTANDTEMDIVGGLEQGADDYITKPFSLAVLRARVNAQLRRIQPAASEDALQIENYRFNFTKMTFFVGEKQVELSKTEQKLLYLLVQNRGRVMSRRNLVDRIWTDGADYVDENALSVTVKRLRDKLDAQDTIKTVYGIGYSWGKRDE